MNTTLLAASLAWHSKKYEFLGSAKLAYPQGKDFVNLEASGLRGAP